MRADGAIAQATPGGGGVGTFALGLQAYGNPSWTVKYAGDAQNAPSSATIVVGVAQSAPTMAALPYREGSCFAVPLRKGGYAVGVVARMAPAGRILLAHLFGPRREVVPPFADVEGIHPDVAFRLPRVGDLNLVNGEWPVLGELPNWDRAAWPMPMFIRREDLSKRAWRTIYHDSDPGKIEREEPVSFETTDLERDALHGAGAVELLMTKLLGGE